MKFWSVYSYLVVHDPVSTPLTVIAVLHGATVVILLGGGTKKRQARDIADAQQRWQDYKRRK